MILSEESLRKLLSQIIEITEFGDFYLGASIQKGFSGGKVGGGQEGFFGDDSSQSGSSSSGSGSLEMLDTTIPPSQYTGMSLRASKTPMPSSSGFPDGESSAAFIKGYERGKKKGRRALSRMSSDDLAKDSIHTACQIERVPKYMMYAMATIESGGNPKVGCNKFGYCGMYQFGRSASKTVGFRYEEIKGKDPASVLKNCIAGARYMKHHQSKPLAQKLGVNFFTLYFMHQQGSSGAMSGYKMALNKPKAGYGKNQKYNHPVPGVARNRYNFFLGWWGYCKGLEDVFLSSGTPGGKIVNIPGVSSSNSTDSKKYYSGGSVYRGRSGKSQSGLPNFAKIPDGRNNYRSGQPTRKGLEHAAKNLGVKVVIKLNGNEGGLTAAEQQRICSELGMKYYRISAHQDYQYGKGYVGTLSKVLPLLNSGNCLIHCTHGADRTGYTVAAHLKSTGKMTNLEALWQYTIGFNSWGGKGGHICKGRNLGYAAYLDGFYPIEQWCKSSSGSNPSNRSMCKGCSERALQRMREVPSKHRSFPRNFK